MEIKPDNPETLLNISRTLSPPVYTKKPLQEVNRNTY